MDTYTNARVEEMLQKDSSYKPEKRDLGLLEIFRPREGYDRSDMRRAYEQAARIWFEQGFQYAADGMSRISLEGNIENERHKTFYREFLALCEKYNIRITYHPAHGMFFEDLHRGPEPKIYKVPEFEEPHIIMEGEGRTLMDDARRLYKYFAGVDLVDEGSDQSAMVTLKNGGPENDAISDEKGAG